MSRYEQIGRIEIDDEKRTGSSLSTAQFRKVEADEFMVATLLPVQRFKKQSDSHVFAKSRGMV